MSTLFSSYDDLINCLSKNSGSYPLSWQLYSPIIKAHATRYLTFKEFDDWLIVPFFQHLWRLDHVNGATKHTLDKILEETEVGLQIIYNNIGPEEFQRFCSDHLKGIMAPTPTGVHDKICELYAERMAMIHYISQGNTVHRVPTGSGKTPDLKISSNASSAFVEVKFISALNPAERFISRYLTYKTFLPSWKSGSSIGFMNDIESTLYNEFQKCQLTVEDTLKLKKFVDDIINNRSIPHSISLLKFEKSDIVLSQIISYNPEMRFPSNISTITDQVNYIRDALTKFLDNYIKRRINQAIKQLPSNEKRFVYLLIETNPEYNPPYDEVEIEKSEILEKFRSNHGLDIDDITIELFPSPKASIKQLNYSFYYSLFAFLLYFFY